MAIVNWGPWSDLTVPDGQFLVFDVVGASNDPVASSPSPVGDLPLSVSFDGATVRSEEDPVGVNIVEPGAEPVDPDQLDERAIALPVPVQSVESAAVVWSELGDEYRWEIDAETREQLAAAPAFNVESVETAVVANGYVELTMTVSNTGERDGVWLAQVSEQSANDISDVFGYEIAVGETITKTVRPPILGEMFGGFRPGRTVTVQFRSTRSFERDVTIPTATPTETST